MAYFDITCEQPQSHMARFTQRRTVARTSNQSHIIKKNYSKDIKSITCCKAFLKAVHKALHSMRAHTLPSRDLVLAPNELGWVSFRIVVEVGMSDGNIEMEEEGGEGCDAKGGGNLESKNKEGGGKSLN
jgi:hypothetical protein